MRPIRLNHNHKDGETLFAIDAVDHEMLVELLAEKLKSDAPNPRRNRVAYMLHAMSPNHEALRARE